MDVAAGLGQASASRPWVGPSVAPWPPAKRHRPALPAGAVHAPAGLARGIVVGLGLATLMWSAAAIPLYGIYVLLSR